MWLMHTEPENILSDREMIKECPVSLSTKMLQLHLTDQSDSHQLPSTPKILGNSKSKNYRKDICAQLFIRSEPDSSDEPEAR